MVKNISCLTAVGTSRIGLGLIFFYCFAASLFNAYFAQIHLTLRFLSFPIFIGEIVIFVCVPLLAWGCKDGLWFSRRSMLLLGLYFGGVLLKALINYHYDGPLSLRNAALFYYPIFAVFAYGFYQKAMVPRSWLMALAGLAAGILFFKLMGVYYWWTYVTLFVIALWNTKPLLWRWLGLLWLAVVFLLGKEYLYQCSRSHLVAVFAAVIFLVSYFGTLLAKRRAYARLTILLISFLFFIMGYFIFSNRNDISSFSSLKGLKALIGKYQAFDRSYDAMQKGFVPQKLPAHLYHYKNLGDLFIVSPNAASEGISVVPKDKQRVLSSNWLKDIQRPRVQEERSLDLNENNIIFRLYVWRDMVREFIQEPKAWGLGFSFGHPQRSRSLEVIGWGRTEWGRDGWTTPHNVFLHIIYRAGILGVLLIGVLFSIIGRLAGDFLKANSVEGGLLVGALIYWLVLSNFLVILELPYNAIVFWSLLGITMAYRDGLKRVREG